MTWSQFIMALAWVIDGDLRKKLKSFIRNRPALALTLLFVMHALGMLYTSDSNYGWNDLRIKLPMLVLPLVVSTSPRLSLKNFNRFMMLYLAAVLYATLHCTIVWLGWTWHHVIDIRDISVFISHIRFSFYIDIGILTIIYFIYTYHKSIPRIATLLLLVLMTWFFGFLVILQAVTGMIILLIVLLGLGVYFIFRLKNKFLKMGIVALLILIPTGLIVYSLTIYKQVSTVLDKHAEPSDTLTVERHNYENHSENEMTENGHLIWNYVCWYDLQTEWPKRSKVSFDDVNSRGHILKYTLIRYMTSKGLRKDAEGMKMLSDEDIRNIEQGATNALYINGGIQSRIHEIAWEINDYLKGGNPSGHSVIQRVEYWKTATEIIKKNPVFGVGTGDINSAFERQYEADGSRLDKHHRLKAHDQYLSITITLGLVGLTIFLFSLFYPIIRNKMWNDYFYATFLFIAILSMFTEDTLETQPGVTFFVFFSVFFLFAKPKEN